MSNFYQSGGINICGCCPYTPDESDEEAPHPPFTGQEFLDTHNMIGDHPYATAFSCFLAVGIDPDTANKLAFGIHSAIGFISNDFENPLRQTALNIFDRLSDMNYWKDSGDTDSEPDGFDAKSALESTFGTELYAYILSDTENCVAIEGASAAWDYTHR